MRMVDVPAPAATIPVSRRTLVRPMMPWPHIVLKPSLWRNSTPQSLPSVTGSVGIAPYMSAWPRGSHMSRRRRVSRCSCAYRRFSSMLPPGIGGKPSTITRSGSPAACTSMVLMTSAPSGGV